MVVIDILSKNAWLEPLKSKHDIAIKNALEHISNKAKRRPKVIQTDKGTEFFNVLVKTYPAENNIEIEKHKLQKDLIESSRGSCFDISHRRTQESILIFFKTSHQNTMHLTTEESKWLLKMLAKKKKLKSG